MVLEPPEESVHRGEDLRTVAEAVGRNGHILHSEEDEEEKTVVFTLNRHSFAAAPVGIR